ncbi:unnamed protein product [Closterium sp. NIES-53]
MESPEIVAEFVAITAQPERVARQYLEAHNWDLQLAVNFFLEHGGDEGGGLGNGITDAIDLTSESPPAAATTRPRTFHGQTLGGVELRGTAVIAGMQQQEEEQAQEEYEGLNPVRPFMTGSAFDRLMPTSCAPATVRAPSSAPIISEPREVREIPIQWDDAASNGNGSAGSRGYAIGGGQRGLGGGQGFGEGRGVDFDETFDRGYGRRVGFGPFGLASQEQGQQQERQQWNQSGGVRIEEVEDGDDGATAGAGAFGVGAGAAGVGRGLGGVGEGVTGGEWARGRVLVQEPGVGEAAGGAGLGAAAGAGMGAGAGGVFGGEAEETGFATMVPASAAAPMDVDQDEDDDVMRAIALSIKTAEEEAASRGQSATASLQPPFTLPETAPPSAAATEVAGRGLGLGAETRAGAGEGTGGVPSWPHVAGYSTQSGRGGGGGGYEEEEEEEEEPLQPLMRRRVYHPYHPADGGGGGGGAGGGGGREANEGRSGAVAAAPGAAGGGFSSGVGGGSGFGSGRDKFKSPWQSDQSAFHPELNHTLPAAPAAAEAARAAGEAAAAWRSEKSGGYSRVAEGEAAAAATAEGGGMEGTTAGMVGGGGGSGGGAAGGMDVNGMSEEEVAAVMRAVEEASAAETAAAAAAAAAAAGDGVDAAPTAAHDHLGGLSHAEQEEARIMEAIMFGTPLPDHDPALAAAAAAAGAGATGSAMHPSLSASAAFAADASTAAAAAAAAGAPYGSAYMSGGGSSLGLPRRPHSWRQYGGGLGEMGAGGSMGGDEEYFKSLIADQEKEEAEAEAEADEEYFKSLIADQEKEEAARRKEEEERQRQQQEEQQRQDELRRQREEEEEEQRQLAAKEASLPLEPAAGEKGAITLMLRLPDGSRLSRRFLTSDTLQTLFDYVDVSKRVKPNTYTIARQFPRRVFQPAEAHATLADLGITNRQEAFYIQQL